MIKYIVTWIISTQVSISCPDANTVDEFGLSNSGYISCTVYHSKIVEEAKIKKFKDRDSAFAFYNRCKKSYRGTDMWFGLGSRITEINISELIDD